MEGTGDNNEEVKLCSACCQEFPRSSFNKKQWMCRNVRRCKDCTEAGREVVSDNPPPASAASAASGGSSSRNNSKKKKGKPIRANHHQGLHKPQENPDAEFTAQIAGVFCSWCGKAEESKELMLCSICSNIEYCSRACQKDAWPEHKKVCEQLKRDRKDWKKERKAQSSSTNASNSMTISEASGVGSYCYATYPLQGAYSLSQISTMGELRGDEHVGTFFASDAAEQNLRRAFAANNGAFAKLQQSMVQATLSQRQDGKLSRTEYFSGNVAELKPQDQFLLSCGTLADIDHAKRVLPLVLHLISISGRKPDGTIPDITDITVRGYNLNALEWAARRGHYRIAEWLATDPRTKVMLTRTDSAPVAWAVYTNKVELAKMLIQHGANSHATTTTVFGDKPPTHLAAENGSFLAFKFLLEECGHDIMERDGLGQNIRTSTRQNNKMWRDNAGCVAIDNYVKSKGVREYA